MCACLDGWLRQRQRHWLLQRTISVNAAARPAQHLRTRNRAFGR